MRPKPLHRMDDTERAVLLDTCDRLGIDPSNRIHADIAQRSLAYASALVNARMREIGEEMLAAVERINEWSPFNRYIPSRYYTREGRDARTDEQGRLWSHRLWWKPLTWRRRVVGYAPTEMWVAPIESLDPQETNDGPR